MTTYTYSIQTDFPNHKVASDRLTQEIQRSSIVITLDHIDTISDVCSICFKAELSGGDKTILDGLVAAHSGEALEQDNPLPWDGPKQTDGSPFVSPCIFPTGVLLYITGEDDSGVKFNVSSDIEENKSVEFQFNDWILLSGGSITYENASIGDYVTLSVSCPATPVTPNQSNTGNCNVVSGIIVPAANDGAFDVDLASANPIIAPNRDGYWEWSYPDTGKGTVTVGNPGSSKMHLCAVDLQLAKFNNCIPMLGSHNVDFMIPAIEPKIILPHWKMKVLVHNSGHTGLKVVWYVTSARVKTA